MEHPPLRATPRRPHPITTTDDARRLATIAVLQSIDRAVARVARQHGDAIAEDVHLRLLRRIDTGPTLADTSCWLDETGEIRELALRAWMRKAADGETSTAYRHRTGLDALLDLPDTREPAAHEIPPAVNADDDPAVLLVSLRRATRQVAMTPRTREIALQVLTDRLAGETFATAAQRAGVPTNTATQYSRRLLRAVAPSLQRRVRRVVREQKSTLSQQRPATR
ncbi:hypothetical protein [Paraconexibacter algicola]|uniref:Uncharacterized protein n=1 Tax=Paraconexibacter algicola TaxID=2133960 RepID=A0A2T4UI50_9ACTN|nr:hypothetical protein [Paraconexibacter algicola]PTL58898.1 hypothetical protein C7Y72_04135 [Paraconexibacter algicola]